MYKSGQNYIPVYKRLSLSADFFVLISALLTVGYFLGYSGSLFPFWVAGIIALVSGVAAAGLGSIVCEFIERSRLLSFGKYHLPLAVSTLVAAASVALMFNISPEWHIAGRVTAAAFSMIGYTLFSYVLFYSGFAVKKTLIGGEDGFSRTGSIVLTLAALSSTALTMLTSLFTDDAAGYAGYIAAIIVLLSGTGVYFMSSPSLPLTLNRSGPEKFRLSKIFSPIFSDHKRLLAGLAFFVAALAVCFDLSTLPFSVKATVNAEVYVSALTATLILFTAVACVAAHIKFRGLEKHRIPSGVFITASAATVLSAGASLTASFFSGDGALAVLLIAAALLGIGFGIAVGCVAKIFGGLGTKGYLYVLFSLYNASCVAIALASIAATLATYITLAFAIYSAVIILLTAPAFALVSLAWKRLEIIDKGDSDD